MIRTFAIAAASAATLAMATVSANAAPAGQSFASSVTSSPMIVSNNHGVCLKHQCPGRYRIVCGCAQGTR
jgi:hypothetical protein